MKQLIAVVLTAIGLSGCVSNMAVQTVQADDYTMNCEQLQYELANLGMKFEDAKDDSGFTGRNVGVALVFWPGLIVNEMRASKNQDSIDDRVRHLSGLYREQCVVEKVGASLVAVDGPRG